ncbi:MAG: metal-dependent hydrolase [Nevskiales bacterium]
MLIAHLVPGYFAAVVSQPSWNPKWSRTQRASLWLAALGATAAPDLDVIYNLLLRGFFGHSVLWTHSVFVHLPLVLAWFVMGRTRSWPYLRTMTGLIAAGGISHLLLDALSHGTPLFYPLSRELIGVTLERIRIGGVIAYLTHPAYLVEALLITLAAGHWDSTRGTAARYARSTFLVTVLVGWAAASIAFLVLLAAPATDNY